MTGVGGSPWIIGPITADGPYFCDPCAALELLAAGSVWIDLEPPPCVVLAGGHGTRGVAAAAAATSFRGHGGGYTCRHLLKEVICAVYTCSE